MIDVVGAGFTGVLSILGLITLVWVWNARNSFTPGNLRLLATGLVSTAISGLFYALWNLLLNLEVLIIEDSFVRETPSNIFIFFFFISMMYNAYMIQRFADRYGFLKKIKK